jgi:hypothetical protein
MGGVEIQLHEYVTLELDGGEWSVSRPFRSTSGEVHHYANFFMIRLLPFRVQISFSTPCSQKPPVYVPPQN